MDRYWCEHCKTDFHEPDAVWFSRYDDDVMDGHIYNCPYCGSEGVKELDICPCCGDEYMPYDHKVELCEDCAELAHSIYKVAESHLGKKYNLEQLFCELCNLKGWV